ncbi:MULTISPECIES: cache domain-containing protein [unclassified Methanoregula]|uniref:cache domain-containing protein n=1 Tax=unclassified Methanoregula TaxID=2649730 RepID=UPI0009D43CD7|nr:MULTISPECIES: cache domain-containing protein [unclassified Methanoregula]OPX62732.1 MAG: Cache domain protein [Methanoregula sp. PtaB.Bin085]OPY36968.1 MAG: Cache domain protein [Methanoregula sp. PtaU1.Bin006]
MRTRDVYSLLLIAACLLLAAGCSRPVQKDGSAALPVVTTGAPVTPAAPAGKISPADLTVLVKNAVAHARANGREKAVAAFNNPEGGFVKDGVYIFAEDYTGTALAEPFEHGIVGTNIGNMTDRYGITLVRNLQETAGYGIGFVSYDYPNPNNNNVIEPKLSVVADADGTYYIGAGGYAGSGMVYPSTVIGPATRKYTISDLTSFVKNGVAYARANGREKALPAFNDPEGQFIDGELSMIAADYNGTVLANGISPQTANEHINLINYHDPDGVRTIREMRDLVRNGGGFSYTVAAVTKDGKTYYAPRIDYAEPVDDTYWIFSGIIMPEYEQLRDGNLTGIVVRNHTRTELYDLVNRAVTYAHTNGKEKTLAEINNPEGSFVNGDLFVWAEDFSGTILADPYWKEGIGKNYFNETDPNGAKITQVSINAVRSGTGFTHVMFPDTSANSSMAVPKLVYMKPVDDTWWIGGGIYGIQVP